MGATVRVNVELKKVDPTIACCYECRHNFQISWQQYRTTKIRCPKCGGECDFEFFPDPNHHMHISVSSVMELGRIIGAPVRQNQYDGEFSPDQILAHEKELQRHRFGPGLLRVARDAKKARTSVVWG